MTDATTRTDRPRRSIVLHMMTWVGNAYLLAFAGETALSIFDLVVGDPQLHAMKIAHPTEYSVRISFALALVLASFLTPSFLLFVPQLPKLPFVLTSGFVVVTLCIGMRMDAPARHAFFDRMTILQPLFVAASFLLLKMRTGAWLLSAANLPRKRHLVARTVFATLASVVMISSAAVALVVVALVAAVERQSGGYLDVTTSGIDVRQSVLTKDGHAVLLTAMLHYGDEDFYRTLLSELPAGSLVLAEGVTDRDDRLKGFVSAPTISTALGLTEQPDFGVTLHRQDRNRDAERPRTTPAESSHSLDVLPPAPGSDTRPDVVRADIDMADFSDVTFAMFTAMEAIYASASITEAVNRLVAAVRSRTREDYATFNREVVEQRNLKVLSVFDERANAYSTIVIPWGAYHMPGLESGLRDRGYHVDSQRMRTVVRFGPAVRSLIQRQ